jgi:hypothetical protein
MAFTASFELLSQLSTLLAEAKLSIVRAPLCGTRRKPKARVTT